MLVHELASEWARERAVRDVEAAATRSATAQSRLAGLRAEIAQSVEGIQQVLEQRRAEHGAAARRWRAGAVRPWCRATPPVQGTRRVPAERLRRLLRARAAGRRARRPAGRRPTACCGRTVRERQVVARAGRPAAGARRRRAAGRRRLAVDDRDARDRGDAAAPNLELDSRVTGRRSPARLRRPVRGDVHHRPRPRRAGASSSTVSSPRHTAPITSSSSPSAPTTSTAVPSFPELAELITGNDVLVGPMRDVELRRAIERPAQRSGSRFEPGLVDLMIADVAGRPGALATLVDRAGRDVGAANRRRTHAPGVHRRRAASMAPSPGWPRTPSRRSGRSSNWRSAGCSSGCARPATSDLRTCASVYRSTSSGPTRTTRLGARRLRRPAVAGGRSGRRRGRPRGAPA